MRKGRHGNTLNAIAKNLLFEDNLCEDALDDLLKEVSNQILGSTKVLLEEQNPHKHYQLSVPEFMVTVSKVTKEKSIAIDFEHLVPIFKLLKD
mgnify:CR=1 FL=1